MRAFAEKTLSFLLILGVVTSGTFFTFPAEKSEAQFEVIIAEDLSKVSFGILQATAATAQASESLFVKEYILDPILYSVAKTIIRQITSDIVNWINRGFQGNPAFITDFEGFLFDVADQEIGKFIESTDLAFLCSPFEFNIRIAIATQFSRTFRDDITCTLTGVVDNVDAFLAGNFSAGGWPGWFELLASPQNNPYGAFITASAQLNSNIARRQFSELTQLEWGRGFLSFKLCREVAPRPDQVGATPDTPPSLECENTTPGVVIEEGLVHVLGSGVRELELADELDEIISALISQLLTQAITSLQGLRGLSASSGGGGGSYLDRLAADTSPRGIPLTPSAPGTTPTPSETQRGRDLALIELNRAIQNEFEFQTIVQETLDEVAAAETLLTQYATCNATDAQATVNAEVLPLKRQFSDEIAFSNLSLSALRELRTRLVAAETQSEVDLVIRDYQNLRINSTVHDAVAVFDARTRRDGIQTDMEALNFETQTKIAACP